MCPCYKHTVLDWNQLIKTMRKWRTGKEFNQISGQFSSAIAFIAYFGSHIVGVWVCVKDFGYNILAQMMTIVKEIKCTLSLSFYKAHRYVYILYTSRSDGIYPLGAQSYASICFAHVRLPINMAHTHTHTKPDLHN